MLYDPKWERKTETKADPFQLGTLIAWLTLQPGDKAYDYCDPHNCMLCQYFRAHGFTNVIVSGNTLCHGPDEAEIDFPRIFSWDIGNSPDYRDTFGAALGRARAFAAESPPQS